MNKILNNGISILMNRISKSIHYSCKKLAVNSENFHSKFVISEEVRESLNKGEEIVALESAIISHGMPEPYNFKTSIELEAICRKEGIIPATIGIINGIIKIGLSKMELEILSDKTQKNLFKVSRRDIPICLSRKYNGGTTVSATMMAANMAGIKLMATGGIGGVHRDFNQSFDVSSDLKEFGRTPVAVISSGVKSILDISRTLEYLETEGVPVVTLSDTSKYFPAFFCRSSGLESPHRVESVEEAGHLLELYFDLKPNTGILLAVPIPLEFSLDDHINQAIQNALIEAKENGITGRKVTPFLLQKINESTGGRSLRSNIALVKNNVLIASKIAKLLAREKSPETINFVKKSTIGRKNIVIIGGINYDITSKAQSDYSIKLDGSTSPGSVEYSFGGVGLNLVECIWKMNGATGSYFISCVGGDEAGSRFLETHARSNFCRIKICSEIPTATYSAFLDSLGNPIVAIGDMNIHECIDVDHIKDHKEILLCSNIVAVDANLPEDSLQFIAGFCHENSIPIWFEPTDGRHIFKIKQIAEKFTYASPNVKELLAMGKILLDDNLSYQSKLSLEEILKIGKNLNKILPNILVTMGENGLLSFTKKSEEAESDVKLYNVRSVNITNIQNASGAGDCLAAATICGLANGLSLDESLRRGLAAAYLSLRSSRAVPVDLDSSAIDLLLNDSNFEISCKVLS